MATKKQDTKNLKNLIIRLGGDTELLRAYSRAPREVMMGADVPTNQIDTVLSGNENKIQKLLGDDHFVSQTVNVVRTKK